VSQLTAKQARGSRATMLALLLASAGPFEARMPIFCVKQPIYDVKAKLMVPQHRQPAPPDQTLDVGKKSKLRESQRKNPSFRDFCTRKCLESIEDVRNGKKLGCKFIKRKSFRKSLVSDASIPPE
jgi:hypothetical protein